MQTRAAIDSLYSVFKAIGGEGGITRRSAPRPSGAALTGVIPASSLPPLADPCRQKFTCQLAERVGFEPTNTVRCYTLSRRAPSTARPPLHKPQSAPTAGRDCSRRTPLVLRFAPDRCSFAATSKIAPAILSNPRTRLGVTHFPGVRLRPLGHLSTRPQGYRRRPTRSNGARTPRKPARTGGPRVSVPGRPGKRAGDA